VGIQLVGKPADEITLLGLSAPLETQIFSPLF
jgi:amidase